MTDWASISQVATAGATLVLSVATFASVRSGNRTARAAEASLQISLRPILMPSRVEDPPEKVGFMDGHWVRVPGSHAACHVAPDAIHLAVALRNVGPGIAILHGWWASPDRLLGGADHAPVDSFRRQTRDLYVPPGDRGFWQGALREPDEDLFVRLRERIKDRQAFTLELLYGDNEGGQRSVTRFSITPVGDDDWFAAGSRHWNLDRQNPR